jgi:ATP-dependent helicase/DNAse subunit B
MDYKTGIVNRNELYGERIRQPQLPLYVQAITAKKNTAPAGVAFAQVRQHECKFEELSEADIFQRAASHASRYAEIWADAHAQWPAQLEQLSKDFLAGKAAVNPIDAKTCQFCDLKALCRINQMRPEEETEAANGH